MMTPGRILRIVAPLFLLLTPHVLDAQDLSGLRHAKPLSISGGLGLRSSFYGVSGIAGRQAPFSYGINANATFSLYGISMPFSFTWYNHDKRGSFRQPFNQFGISPSYKWLKVHLGYRNLSFSEFTLNGYTFLGAGVEANPGKVRLGAVYGRFNQNSTYNLSMTGPERLRIPMRTSPAPIPMRKADTRCAASRSTAARFRCVPCSTLHSP